MSSSGTQIHVIGVIPAGQGSLKANYTIDYGEPRTRWEPTLTQNQSLPNQMLFLSEILDMGEHNLTVDILETGGDRNFTFQMFNVAMPTIGMNKSMDNKMEKGVGGDKDSGNQGSNTAAIIGGILGSIIFLILAFFCVFFFWRRRRLARISNVGQNRLPPMMYYAQSIPDGSPRGKLTKT